MFRTFATVLILAVALAASGQAPKGHGDYVPNEKTAVQIAEAVLIAQFGEERVKRSFHCGPVTAMGMFGLLGDMNLGRVTKVAAWQYGLTNTQAAL
jgi:hypothetical protein